MQCGMCVSKSEPNICNRPNCHGHNLTDLYGECHFSQPGNLAEELSHASPNFPPMPTSLKRNSAKWWAANEAVSPSSSSEPPTEPTLVSNCAEADAHQIWVGPDQDYLCREYSAELLGTTADRVPCVCAMEGVGFLQSVKNFPLRYKLEVAVIRAASNWDMYPLTSVNGTTDVWEQNIEYVSAEEHLDLVKEGYQYAVLTSNSIILAYLKNKMKE